MGGELEDTTITLGEHVGFAMRIGPSFSVQHGEDTTAETEILMIANGVAIDVEVGDDLRGLLDASDFTEVDGIGEAGGDGVALGVAGEITSADARHDEKEKGGGGENGSHNHRSGAGQRGGEAVHGRNG